MSKTATIIIIFAFVRFSHASLMMMMMVIIIIIIIIIKGLWPRFDIGYTQFYENPEYRPIYATARALTVIGFQSGIFQSITYVNMKGSQFQALIGSMIVSKVKGSNINLLSNEAAKSVADSLKH